MLLSTRGENNESSIVCYFADVAVRRAQGFCIDGCELIRKRPFLAVENHVSPHRMWWLACFRTMQRHFYHAFLLQKSSRLFSTDDEPVQGDVKQKGWWFYDRDYR